MKEHKCVSGRQCQFFFSFPGSLLFLVIIEYFVIPCLCLKFVRPFYLPFSPLASPPSLSLASSLPPAVAGCGASNVLIVLVAVRANSPSHASAKPPVLLFYTPSTPLLRISCTASKVILHHPYSSSTPLLRSFS